MNIRVSLLLLTLTSIHPLAASALSQGRLSLEELIQDSSLVVEGVIYSATPNEAAGGAIPFTEYALCEVKLILGSAELEDGCFIFDGPGAHFGDHGSILAGVPLLFSGDHVLLFLTRYEPHLVPFSGAGTGVFRIFDSAGEDYVYGSNFAAVESWPELDKPISLGPQPTWGARVGPADMQDANFLPPPAVTLSEFIAGISMAADELAKAEIQKLPIGISPSWQLRKYLPVAKSKPSGTVEVQP